MDEHTSNDIYIYATSRFERMTKITGHHYDDLIGTIIARADSVFLWVKLVIDEGASRSKKKRIS